MGSIPDMVAALASREGAVTVTSLPSPIAAHPPAGACPSDG